MFWVKLIGGIVLALIGAVWIGQGFNLIKGSGMSGHGGYAALGVVVVLCGAWVLWGVAQTRMAATRGR